MAGVPGDASSSQLGRSFGWSGRRYPSSSNSTISSVTDNRRSYYGPFFDERGNKLNWLLIWLRWLIRKLSRTVLQSINHVFGPELRSKTCSPLHKLSTLKTTREITTKCSYNDFKYPRLSKEEINIECELELGTWVDTGCSGRHTYVEEFIIGNTITAISFSSSLGKLDNLPYAHVLYAFDHMDELLLLLKQNNTIYLGEGQSITPHTIRRSGSKNRSLSKELLKWR